MLWGCGGWESYKAYILKDLQSSKEDKQICKYHKVILQPSQNLDLEKHIIVNNHAIPNSMLLSQTHPITA